MSEYRPLVLMVEDNPEILYINGKWLHEAGFDTISAETLAEARAVLESQSPDIVVLDIILPDGDGLLFLPEFKTLCDAPVLFCSSKSEDGDILRGLEAGGDDYIPKPYNVDILVARVKVMWRKEQANRAQIQAALAAKTQERIVERGPLKLDLFAGRAYMNGEDAALKPKEFALLVMLTQNEGRELSEKELYEGAWNLPANNDTRTVKVHISKMKSKLKIADGGAIRIVFNDTGYVFSAP
jgi:DNA-binding response OmpR family regulator